MALNDVLSEFATAIGLKNSEIETLRNKQVKLSEAIRANLDALDKLKKDVDDLDAQLLQKKKEFDAAGPGHKRIVKVELALLFSQQDHALGRLPLISDQLQRDEMIKDKLDVLIFAAEHPALPDDEIDDIILNTREFLDDEKSREKAAKELEGTEYQPQGNNTELDDRINTLATGIVPTKQETVDPLDERIAQLG